MSGQMGQIHLDFVNSYYRYPTVPPWEIDMAKSALIGSIADAGGSTKRLKDAVIHGPRVKAKIEHLRLELTKAEVDVGLIGAPGSARQQSEEELLPTVD